MLARAALAVVACSLLYSYALWRERPTTGPSGVPRPLLAPPAAHDGILVVAPHCDDETLGAGGLVFDAARRGAAVYVALMTNGDGFTLGARREFLSLRTNSARLVEFGYLRQGESLEALGVLGVPAAHVFFLGYPDRGLAAMWHEHWDQRNPYVSKYTRTSASPYANSYHKNAPYYGEDVVQALEDIIMKTHPTTVLTSAPVDGHGDHWATYNFVMYACEDLRERGLLPSGQPRVLWYVVHRGEWPYPKGLRPDMELWPPRGLGIEDVRWLSYRLSREAVLAKANAIRKYRSQMLIMARYLLSFARTTELFAEATTERVPWVTPPGPAVDGRLADWRSTVGTAMHVHAEPTNDCLLRQFGGAGDFTGMAVARDEANLYIGLLVRRAASKEVVYRVHLHPVGRGRRGWVGPEGDIDLAFRPGRSGAVSVVSPAGGGRDLSGVEAASRGREIEMKIPLRLLGNPRTLFVAVESRFQGIMIDQTMWRVLDLSQASDQGPEAEAEAEPEQEPRTLTLSWGPGRWGVPRLSPGVPLVIPESATVREGEMTP
ncbi:MAG: PIG-L family deacetylase [Betaproteobacteria bacterium]